MHEHDHRKIFPVLGNVQVQSVTMIVCTWALEIGDREVLANLIRGVRMRPGNVP
jgi:hypothetical protein